MMIIHGVRLTIMTEDPNQALPRIKQYALSRWGVDLCRNTTTETLEDLSDE